jgi:hypothetical protein
MCLPLLLGICMRVDLNVSFRGLIYALVHAGIFEIGCLAYHASLDVRSYKSFCRIAIHGSDHSPTHHYLVGSCEAPRVLMFRRRTIGRERPVSRQIAPCSAYRRGKF